MDLFEAIQERASYRKRFSDTPVTREQLEQIVSAGIRAPSGYNAQTTSFLVVTDPSLRTRITELAGERDVLTTAQAFILVVMDPRRGDGRDFGFGVEDYAAATENMLLAITALGLASVWIDGGLRSRGIARAIGELVGIPDDREVRVLLPVGVPEERPVQAEKRPLEERAWFNEWGGP